ncbi:protein PRRC2C [Drosophila busckii]|nr:protein PRRC2C [Drosophila busckii]
MRGNYLCALALLGVLASAQAQPNAADQTPSALLPLEARSADLSEEEDVISNSYVLPNQIFNDGKPYYARQDPVSGQLDFTAKKPAGIEPEFNEVLDPKEKIVLNSGSTPNIHDFLNLPVKYSSNKFVYPLVSSSYANLKYQGSNNNYVTNKKPTVVQAPITPAPASYQNAYTPPPTTKLAAVTPTTAQNYYSKPTTTTTTTTTTSAAPKSTTTASTTTTTTTRRVPPPTTASTTTTTRLSTTRKKYMPTRKNFFSSTAKPSTTIRQLSPTSSTTPKPTQSSSSSSTSSFTTHHPTPQAAIFPTEPTTSAKMYLTTTTSSRPAIHFTQGPAVSSSSTLATKLPQLDSGDIYHALGKKKTQQEQQQEQQLSQPTPRPPMTLSDIFNSLAEEEAAVASNYKPNLSFDAQGNLVQPISPGKPAPFAVQSSQANKPAFGSEQQLISGSQENFSNEYVSYQVQQPNVMQYRPVPGQINNVVISPGQQSASFVLGSQQQVGHHGSVQQAPLLPKEPNGMQYGQVINEDISKIQRPTAAGESSVYREPAPEAPSPYQQLPLVGSRPTKTAASKPSTSKPNLPLAAAQTQQQLPIDSSQDTKELLVSSNIRFPLNDEQPMKSAPPTTPHINGHAQPLSLQQLQQSNTVVFPKLSEEEQQPQQSVQIQQHEVVSLNQHKQQLTFPAAQPSANERQPPSQEMAPPPRYAPQAAPVQRPNANPAFYKDFDRKSQLEQRLPNILPQFRPNAKISSGHPQQHQGNMRLPAPTMQRPYNPATPPQFAHRRQTLLQQQQQQQQLPQRRYPMQPDYMANDVHRRIYRPADSRAPHLRNRLYARQPNVPQHVLERHAPLPQQQQQPDSYRPMLAESIDDLNEEDLVINDPPRAPNNARQEAADNKLEAVVTLQMLQSQKKPLSYAGAADDTGAGEIQVTDDNDPQAALAGKQDKLLEHYAVYPLKKTDNQSASSDSKEVDGPAAALEYQNTPFSVIRDQPQEPILKNKKPLTQQQQLKSQQQPKQKFPYAIEKPDPSYTQLHAVPGMPIAPRIINSAFSSGTEAPIAFAYTPTEPNTLQRVDNAKLPTKPAAAAAAPTSDDFDLRGHNFEKNFQAPFVPSVSLGAAGPSDPALSNWKIVSNQANYEKNAINRADVDIDEQKATEANTEKNFELDSFQPQLLSGFKPIYPPDYKQLEQAPAPAQDKPQALALTASSTTVAAATTTTTTATTKTPTIQSSTTVAQAKPTGAEKKSTFETNLAALLFGDDEDLENGARQAAVVKQDKVLAGTINVARMGPRSLFR